MHFNVKTSSDKIAYFKGITENERIMIAER
jgi:hypothetical protein